MLKNRLSSFLLFLAFPFFFQCADSHAFELKPTRVTRIRNANDEPIRSGTGSPHSDIPLTFGSLLQSNQALTSSLGLSLPAPNSIPTTTPIGGLSYNGGHILTNPTLYYIFYGEVSESVKTILIEFAQNLGGSPYWNMNTTFYEIVNSKKIYNTNQVTFGGSASIPLSSYSNNKNLSLTDIRNLAIYAVNAGVLPNDKEGLYLVITDPNITQYWVTSKGMSTFCGNYCGWHYGGNGAIQFGFVGDASSQCPSSCGVNALSPNNNPAADAMISVIAHELAETVTDPVPSSGWVDSTTGEENGDKCGWKFGTKFTTGTGGIANLTLANGKSYLAQQLWVNLPGAVGYCHMDFFSPVAVIAPPTSTVSAGVPNFQFDGSGSYDPYVGGSISSYTWDFGDGTVTASSAKPIHPYVSPGTYNVGLTVSNSHGFLGRTTTSVVAQFLPIAVLSSPTFSYLNGIPTVNLDGSGSHDSYTLGGISTYDWNFGDGFTASSTRPTQSHPYSAPGNYTVTLTVTNTTKNNGSKSVAVQPQFSPIAVLSSPTFDTSGGVQLNGSASHDSYTEGAISSYSWNFGDSSTASTGPTQTHTYATPGIYTVTLTVTNSTRQTGTKSVRVQPQFLPIAVLATPKITLSNGLPSVKFDGTGSHDFYTGGTISSYKWDFGDSSTASTSATQTHTYASPGTYKATLTVTNSRNSSGTATLIIDTNILKAPSGLTATIR